jgi:hypothetical protein
MAKNAEGNVIWISVGVTKNLGNYESFRIDGGVSAEVDDINDEEAWQRLWNLVDAQIEEQLKDSGLKSAKP